MVDRFFVCTDWEFADQFRPEVQVHCDDDKRYAAVLKLGPEILDMTKPTKNIDEVLIVLDGWLDILKAARDHVQNLYDGVEW
jgi:hypothetical protein